MTSKTIVYTVDFSGINPKVRQDGGVQGDHRVVALEFNISDKLYERLRQKAATIPDGKIYYHFEMYNGEGACESTLAQELANKQVVFHLEEWITRYGGIIKVVLVLTVGDSTETLQELYSFPAVLSLKSRPTGSEPSRKNYQSMALMSVETIKAAQRAVEDAESAAESAQAAETAAKNAENFANALQDAEVVFKSDWDEEEQPIPIDLEIDDFLSDVSTNPVQNKVVKAALDGLKIEVDDELSNASENPISNKAVAQKFSKIVDYIVESGTDGIWTYRKWASGIAECWCRTSCTTKWESEPTTCCCVEKYPFTFVGVPALQCSAMQFQTYNSYVAMVYSENNTATGFIRCMVEISDDKPCWVNFHAIGRWK